MANERDRDDLDSNPPGPEDDARDLGDDEFDDEEAHEEDLDDEEQLDADDRVTGEVGSEGGSPGETVVTRRRDQPVKGSEAGETWSPAQGDEQTVERVGEDGQPRRRNP